MTDHPAHHVPDGRSEGDVPGDPRTADDGDLTAPVPGPITDLVMELGNITDPGGDVDPVLADEPPVREPRSTKPRPKWHTVLRITALIVLAAVVVSVLWGKLPSLSEVWNALLSANGWWVLACAVLQVMSIGMFARQQRRLLRAFGVRLSFVRVGAITYSATAIANSFPAGGAVSAGWSFKQFKARGASSATAVTVTLLSGVLSIVGLVLLYLVGLLAATWTRLLKLAENHPGWAVVIGVAILAVLVAVIRLIVDRSELSNPDSPTPKLDKYQDEHPKLGAAVRQVLTTLRQARRVRLLDWNLALFFTLAKWVLDAASLFAACKAFDISINFLQLSAVYLTMQLIRQLPLTPGGVGVIEVALLAALVSAGAPEAAATAAVLVYRLFSAWLLIPIGYLAMAAMARWDRRHETSQAPAT
jgi:putative heme transporter